MLCKNGVKKNQVPEIRHLTLAFVGITALIELNKPFFKLGT